MTTVQSNEAILKSYELQWETLENQLETAEIDKKVKDVALGTFREIKKGIVEDSLMLKDVMSSEGFISILSSHTTELASIVTDAKIHDMIFGKDQEKFLAKESDRGHNDQFIAEEILKDLAKANMEI